MKAQYCSPECRELSDIDESRGIELTSNRRAEKADWSRHKVLCDHVRVFSSAVTRKSHFCCPPHVDDDRDDFESGIGSKSALLVSAPKSSAHFCADLFIDAARSALRLDFPDSMERSHAFVLRLVINESWTKGDDPSLRWKLVAGKALPFPYVLQHMQWTDAKVDKEGRMEYLTRYTPLDRDARAEGYEKQYSQVLLYKTSPHPDAHYRFVQQKPYVRAQDPHHPIPFDSKWFNSLKKELDRGVGLVDVDPSFFGDRPELWGMMEQAKHFGVKIKMK